MRPLNQLKQFARAAAALLARQRDLAASEVYCGASEHRVVRLNCTSDIPSRGVEEFKSLNADGFALRVVMRGNPQEIASAAIAGDLSLEAVREALARARHCAVTDPHFPGLPREPHILPPGINAGAAGDLMRAGDGALAHAAWRIIGGALRAFHRGEPIRMARPGLIIGGDLSLIRDRVVLASSNFADLRADQSAHFVCSVTALVEAFEAKGTATAMGDSIGAMGRAAARLGRDAVARALALRHGERPPAGTYRVVLGPQPVAEIINYMMLPSLTARAFQSATSAYLGRFGASVIDARLSLADDPLARIGPVRRHITCEGLPAARTELICDGRLTGLLANHYDAHRLLTDEHRGQKLGPAASDGLAFPPRSGYRLGDSPARRYDAHPGTAGTNVIMRTTGGVDDRELIAAVGDGIYIGRIWYTYPINGQRAGDFTCTVSGDSYMIRDGRLTAPLAPNSLRLNANIEAVFAKPLAVARKSQPVVVWGSPEAYFVPALALAELPLARIGAADSD